VAPVAQKTFPRLLLIAGCSLVLASCGGSPAKTADGETTESGDAKSGLMSVGADIGCGIASLINKDCAKGARIGAKVADKVFSWVFKSLKTADGKTVNKEYETKKIIVSKTDVQAMSFTSRVETTDAATPAPAPANTSTPAEPTAESKSQTAKTPAPATASEVKITSNTDLVGYGDKVPVVTQKYALYDEKNKLVSTQTEKVAAVDGAGRYETEAKVRIPKTKGKGGKQYRVETTLMVNGKEYKKNSYDVALLDDGTLRLALAGAPATL